MVYNAIHEVDDIDGDISGILVGWDWDGYLSKGGGAELLMVLQSCPLRKNYKTEHTNPCCHPGITDGAAYPVACCAPAEP